MTLPAFRPSELMAVLRQLEALSESLHLFRFLTPSELKNENAIPKAMETADDLLRQLEALRLKMLDLALDYSGGFHPKLKQLITSIIGKLSGKFYADYDFADERQRRNCILINRDVDFPDMDKVQWKVPLNEFSEDINDLAIKAIEAMTDIYIYQREPDQKVEWFLACDRPAQLRFHLALRAATNAAQLPVEIPIRPTVNLEDLVEGLNAFMKHHPDKGFKFSGAGRVLQAIPKKPRKNSR